MRLLLGYRWPELVAAVFRWAEGKIDQQKAQQRLENTYLVWIRALLLRKQHGKPIPDLGEVLEPLGVQLHFAEAGHFLRSQI